MARVYIAEHVYNALKDVYSSKEESVNRAVGGFLLMRKLSLKKLKSLFSQNEKNGIVAAFNGTIIEFDFIPPKTMLIAGIEDSISLDGLDSMYQFNGVELLQKLQELEEIDCLFLLEETHRFWNNDGEKELETFLV